MGQWFNSLDVGNDIDLVTRCSHQHSPGERGQDKGIMLSPLLLQRGLLKGIFLRFLYKLPAGIKVLFSFND